MLIAKSYPVNIIYRSLSRASITVQVSTNVDMVQLDTSGNTTSSFIVQVCANYSGRGLDGRPLSKNHYVP